MELRTSFTTEEVSAIFEEFGFETSISEPEDNEDAWTIECNVDDIEFSCLMFPQEPFFERVVLVTSRFVDVNPFKFSDGFNRQHTTSSSYVMRDNEDHVLLDQDGDAYVALRTWISFDGGVSPDHVEFLIATWIDDLFDFHEVEFEDDEVESNLPAMNDKVREMSVVEQIEWTLGDSVRRSAREIADYLMLDKHSVNSALYKDKAKFKRDSGQPPRWSLAD